MRLPAIILLVLFFFSGITLAETPNSLAIKDIEVRSVDAQTTDLKFIFAAKPEFHYFNLSNPSRFVLDVSNGQLQITIHDSALTGTPIKAVRQGAQANQVLRLVFDLNQNVQVKTLSADDQSAVFELKTINASQKPVVVQKTVTPSKANTVSLPSTMDTAVPTVVTKTAPQGMRKVVVVIDAGHGGKDPGAHGMGGSQEKNVVLGISKSLYQQINANPGMRAVMTRDGDYYLTLRQRLQKARAAKGDIFIAVHADAFPNAASHGASVYALSLKGASSEAARWLAEKDNYSELGGVDLSDKNNLLRSVLIDLSQTATITASLRLGDDILGQLGGFTPLHHSEVEQARFVVLKSPDIPSVLVETGFLSNKGEEAKLRDPRYQARVADAIYQGTLHYFYAQPPEGTFIAAQVLAGKKLG